MSLEHSIKRLIWIPIISLTLSACSPYKPPYNNFQTPPERTKNLLTHTAIGGGIGAIVGAFIGGASVVGLAAGGTAGAVFGIHKSSKTYLVKQLQKQDIQYVEYGDTITLVVPTDRYFLFDSPQLNDLCYAGLVNILKFIKFHTCGKVYVAGFTDNVGSRKHKRLLSQSRAEAMLTFLWANDIPASRLHAEGYADKHTIGDNHWIRGSAYNRRLEIQIVKAPAPLAYLGVMK